MSKQTFAQLQSSYDNLKNLIPKERFQALKDLANALPNLGKEAVSLEEIELYIKILKDATRLHGSRFSRKLSSYIGHWLEMTGNANVAIIRKKNGKINSEMSVDTGKSIIALGDPAWFTANDIYNLDESQQLKAMNNGDIFIFYSEPMEEACNIQIRIVDAALPVLTAKEFKFVVASSEIVTINIQSTSIMCADPQSLSPKNQIDLSIEPGLYKICAYQFQIPNKLQSFYIVLCKTEEVLANQLNYISSLGVA